MTAEETRLQEAESRTADWKRWGPYLSERQWGTVREDYSRNGDTWRYFPHDHARSRAYRWGEDGLLGITDRQCRLCFSLALWNERDPILKERLFGLTGPEGNHGEDVKECYYYLDSTPTHSYMKALYKYPQAEFPYAGLVWENGRRGRNVGEYELLDTGAFAENRYFDIFAEYAKGSPNDILLQITAINRGPEPARLHLLPTLWFRNVWSWGNTYESLKEKPRLVKTGDRELGASHETLGKFRFLVDRESFGEKPIWLFTENETNATRLFGSANSSDYLKDAFHDLVLKDRQNAVNPEMTGTKAAIHHVVELAPGQEVSYCLRLVIESELMDEPFGPTFRQTFDQRIREGEEFYQRKLPSTLNANQCQISRQAYAGLLWTKQFYYLDINQWLRGDDNQPPPPPGRDLIRNHGWPTLFNRDIISMPDKWEYPWYAAWDLAFHMIPFVTIDPDFAKKQLILFLREWYMHPNGQIPAYEFNFGDVNPPVHAWACWRVYKMSGPHGSRDRSFLERAFHKLLLNFTWWVNRKDTQGNNLFSGGFLGLDNIGVFDRSKHLPTGGFLEQADGTAWMAFFCGTMLSIALELAIVEPEYEDIASKFFEHFLSIADAINHIGGCGLWDETDGFYYDELNSGDVSTLLKTRSLVGIVPLFAVEILEEDIIKKLPGFRKRMNWLLENRKDLARLISCLEVRSKDGNTHQHRLLAIPSREKLERILKYIFSEEEFLSPHGIRSVSKIHEAHPYVFRVGPHEFRVDYEPGESTTDLFGGNSNWRGPVWFPMNFLLIEALERYHHFYGNELQVEYPTGSGVRKNLKEIADDLCARLVGLFLPDENGERPCHGDQEIYARDPNWKDLILFYEYFHGDNGRGVGAAHQTGWTALAAKLLESLQ